MISLKSKTKKLDEPIKDKAGFLDYLIILIIGIILLYPIIWMFMAAFKSNEEIFGTVALFRISGFSKTLLRVGKVQLDILTQDFLRTQL